MAVIDFEMVNGRRATLTIRDGEDPDEALRVARDDPSPWIRADHDTFLRKDNVVWLQLARERRI